VARPRQPRTSSSHYEPDIDVDQFHAAADSMARIVQRVRGEEPAPPSKEPRRRARQQRVPFHPAAAPRRAVSGLVRPRATREALRRAERRPQRDRRPLVVLGVVALLLAAGIALATTAPDDDEVRAGPDREAATDGGETATTGPPTTRATTTTTTTTEPPAATVEYPGPGVVSVTAPAAEVVLEATGTCWLRIVTDGGPPTDLLMEEGDRHRVEGGERIEMRVGNPAGLVVTTSGTPIDLGDHGGQPIDLVVTVG
jgi:hypothetical protein